MSIHSNVNILQEDIHLEIVATKENVNLVNISLENVHINCAYVNTLRSENRLSVDSAGGPFDFGGFNFARQGVNNAVVDDDLFIHLEDMFGTGTGGMRTYQAVPITIHDTGGEGAGAGAAGGGEAAPVVTIPPAPPQPVLATHPLLVRHADSHLITGRENASAFRILVLGSLSWFLSFSRCLCLSLSLALSISVSLARTHVDSLAFSLFSGQPSSTPQLVPLGNSRFGSGGRPGGIMSTVLGGVFGGGGAAATRTGGASGATGHRAGGTGYRILGSNAAQEILHLTNQLANGGISGIHGATRLLLSGNET